MLSLEIGIFCSFSESSKYFLLISSYEAYALYQFFALCIELANGWKNMEAAFVLRNERPWPLPCCCFNLKPTGKTLVLYFNSSDQYLFFSISQYSHNKKKMWCQRGILQYVLIRPVTTIASAVLLATELYNEGEWKISMAISSLLIIQKNNSSHYVNF